MNKQNILLCLMVVGVWIIKYLCPSTIVKLDSGHIPVELSNGRWVQVVKDPRANYH